MHVTSGPRRSWDYKCTALSVALVLSLALLVYVVAQVLAMPAL